MNVGERPADVWGTSGHGGFGECALLVAVLAAASMTLGNLSAFI
jgi:NADH:ubiquinone oxidoreductase subunit 2 (subunit N)